VKSLGWKQTKKEVATRDNLVAYFFEGDAKLK